MLHAGSSMQRMQEKCTISLINNFAFSFWFFSLSVNSVNSYLSPRRDALRGFLDRNDDASLEFIYICLFLAIRRKANIFNRPTRAPIQ